MKRILTLAFCLCIITAHAQHTPVPPTDEFKITGIVKKELTLRLKDLAAFKQDALGDLPIKNKKGEPKDVAHNMKGVLLKTILDSADITTDKHKEYSELVIVLIASDGYKNVYSWNELYNNDAGNHVYVITEIDGKVMDQITGRILVVSMSDTNSGRRHLKGLSRIEVRRL